jgi:regulator of protease activity HflC (stomatin/prohibitin superfamily)
MSEPIKEEPKVELTAEQIATAEAEKKAKKELKAEVAKNEKAAREAKKAGRLAERQAQGAAKNAEFVKDPNDPCADKFGDMDIIRSQCNPEDRFTKIYVAVKDINDSHVGK